MAEATLFFLENLSIAPGKIHPARALQRAEAEYSLGTLDNERTSELAKSFGCQRVNKSSIPVIKAVIGMHLKPFSHGGHKSACVELGVSYTSFSVWKSTLSEG